jgi:hypothetical protein
MAKVFHCGLWSLMGEAEKHMTYVFYVREAPKKIKVSGGNVSKESWSLTHINLL